MPRFLLSGLFWVVWGLAGPAGAQSASTVPPSGHATDTELKAIVPADDSPTVDSRLSHQDEAFVQQAAQAGAFEIQAAEMVLQRVTSLEVRAYAQQMIEDHTRMDEALTRLAAEKDVHLTLLPSGDQEDQLRALREQRGGFERAYVGEVAVTAHQDAVALFEHAAKNITDADVRAFAQKALPELQHHLEQGEALRDALTE